MCWALPGPTTDLGTVSDCGEDCREGSSAALRSCNGASSDYHMPNWCHSVTDVMTIEAQQLSMTASSSHPAALQTPARRQLRISAGRRMVKLRSLDTTHEGIHPAQHPLPDPKKQVRECVWLRPASLGSVIARHCHTTSLSFCQGQDCWPEEKFQSLTQPS